MTTNKPVHEVRIGAIRAAIWKNSTETGIRYSSRIQRLYKDGDKWASSDSFGRDDLLLLAKVADQTHSWICSQQLTDQAAEAPASATEHT